MTAERVLVTGSRAWVDVFAIRSRLAALPPGSTVVVGDARGADRIAARVARSLGLDVVVYPADWSKHGRRAGILRNLAMLDEPLDRVLAFYIADSPGTAHAIAEARRRGLPLAVVTTTHPDPVPDARRE